ncbi:MAG: phosphoribosyltransferase family protein [Pseudomonadota bacterium]
MSDLYRQEIQRQSGAIDLGFWRRPVGVAVPDDELSFLLVPDAVEAAACFELARQVHAWQHAHQNDDNRIDVALMVTMGGLLPSVLLYDHLVQMPGAKQPTLEFGTVGVSLYAGPGERLDKPIVDHPVSVPVQGRTVLVIDDLGDYGGTMNFLSRQLLDTHGAQRVLSLMLYMKPAALKNLQATFWFGETPQDTWIITPREQVETLSKRVPVWRQRGANEAECRRRLVDIIGYPPAIVDYYLPRAWAASELTRP